MEQQHQPPVLSDSLFCSPRFNSTAPTIAQAPARPRKTVINSTGNLPAKAYFTERLQKLIQHDKVGPISYLDTLRIFLWTSMSYSQTAEGLYVHRSTVVDRINQIERELDISLKTRIPASSWKSS